MKRPAIFSALLVCAFGLAAVPAARSCDFGGFGFGYDYGYLYNILRHEVPHFAAFPPVYYSVPVPRTYGYGPFAYPPFVMTPEVVSESQPEVIINRYVPEKESDSSANDRTAAIPRASVAPQPLVIVNPFVTASEAVARNER